MKLIHVSDLHIGGGDAQLDGTRKFVRHMLDSPVEDASIIISGDIVDGRNGAEWVEARKVLASLSVRYKHVLICCGNHDVSDKRGLTYDKRAADRSRFYINGLCPDFKLTNKGLRIFDHPDFKIVGVDSNLGNDDDFFAPLARGEIGDGQLLGLEMELQDDKPIVIVIHHKAYCQDFFHLLEDADKFIKLIERRDNVKAIMFGHLHMWSLVNRKGVEWMESDNTSISHRYRILDTNDWSITEHKF